jgi:hypothetical protein
VTSSRRGSILLSLRNVANLLAMEGSLCPRARRPGLRGPDHSLEGR